MTDAAIRRLRWWHIERLLPIEAELFTVEAWTAGMFWAELAAGHYYRAAMDGDRVIGYAGLAVVPGEEAWVNNIAVTRERQRGGVGAALLTDLLAEAARRRVLRVNLEVAADNLAAQAMYDRFGFDGVAIRRGYYQPSNTDALVMIRAG